MSLASSFPCLSRMRALLFHIHFLDLTLNMTTFLWLALTCNQIGIVLYKKDWCFCMGGKRHPPPLHLKYCTLKTWKQCSEDQFNLVRISCILWLAVAGPWPRLKLILFLKAHHWHAASTSWVSPFSFFPLLATGFAPTTSTGHIMQNRDWQNHLHSGSVYTLKHKGYTPKLVLWTDMAFLVCVVETQTVCTGVWLLRHPGP